MRAESTAATSNCGVLLLESMAPLVGSTVPLLLGSTAASLASQPKTSVPASPLYAQPSRPSLDHPPLFFAPETLPRRAGQVFAFLAPKSAW